MVTSINNFYYYSNPLNPQSNYPQNPTSFPIPGASYPQNPVNLPFQGAPYTQQGYPAQSYYPGVSYPQPTLPQAPANFYFPTTSYKPVSYNQTNLNYSLYNLLQTLMNSFMPIFNNYHQNNTLINKGFNTINTDKNENIDKNELTTYLKNNFGLKADADESLIDELIAEISVEMPEDNKINKKEFIKYVDINENGKFEEAEIAKFKEKLQLKTIDINNTSEYLKINTDKNESISKEELAEYMKNKANLKAGANVHLRDDMLEQFIAKVSTDKNNTISKEEFVKYVDVNKDGSISSEEIKKFDDKLKADAGVINGAKEWQADNNYGKIDWNQDGTFGNEGSWYDNFITHHGYDKVFNHFGVSFRNINLEKIANNHDNSSKDTDKRANFISNGSETIHKISDTKYGFSVSKSSDRTKAKTKDGTDINSLYNYVVWNKEDNTYTLGIDANNDGNLTGSEIKGIVENVSDNAKTASPLTFDLNGDGKVETTGIKKEYDINGDGKMDKTAWAAAGDGVLAFDADGDGKIGEDGKELFGNNTDIDGDGKKDGHKNGFEALKALAEKFLGAEAVADNKLDAKEIKELEEKAKLSMLVNNKQKTLSELNITEISLGYEEKGTNADENGNEHRQVGDGFVINGQKSKVNDVWFKYN